MDAAVKKLFEPRLTPQQYMIIAVSDADPDMRRVAVSKIADSKNYDEDWAIKGLTAIALLESDPQARCVAVRTLGQTHDPRAAEACLKILTWREQPPEEVRPPDDLCRWDACAALANLTGAGVVPDELRAEVRDAFLERLRTDSERHVRMAAAQGLRSFPEEVAVRALIEGLRDEDFAVAYECEDTLVYLTGVTHECDPYLWQRWVEEHPSDLFAQAGNVPESRKLPYTDKWGKLSHESRQLYRWLFPGAKE